MWGLVVIDESFMVKQHSIIGALIFVMVSACSLDTKLDDFVPLAHAQELDYKKKDKCTKDTDCRAFNQDCCGEESGIVAAHRDAAREMAKKRSAKCAKEHADARAQNLYLCKDKKSLSAFKYPKVGCDNGACVVKSSGEEVDKTACTFDAQCEIFDPDCCESGDNVVAINFQFGQTDRQKKATECKERREEAYEKLKKDPKLAFQQPDPALCRGLKPKIKKKHTAACVEKKCVVVDPDQKK